MEQQITERAKQAEKEWLLSDDVTRYGYAQGYAHGATEQRKIDTDIICDLMIDMLNDGVIETRDIGAVNMKIRKAMEDK